MWLSENRCVERISKKFTSPPLKKGQIGEKRAKMEDVTLRLARGYEV